MRVRRAWACSLLFGLTTACGGEEGGHEEEHHEMPEAAEPLQQDVEAGPIFEARFDRAAIEGGFTDDGEGQLRSEVMRLAGPVSRASVWVSRAGEVPIRVSVRAGWSSGQSGPWVPLQEVWSEGTELILAADLETAATSLWVRVAAEDLPAIDQLVLSANVPLSPERRDGLLPDPEVATSSATPRADWGAAPAVCGGVDAMPRGVTLTRMPLPDDVEDHALLLRSIQALDQQGRLWCDVRSSYLVGDGEAWVGRGTRRAALALSGLDDSGRTAVLVLGCEDSPAKRDRVTALLAALTEEHGLSASSAFDVPAEDLCGDSAWLRATLTDWLATDPFNPVEPPKEATLTGAVTDGTTPLSGVDVSCACGRATTTGQDGGFTLSVPAGTHQLRFTKAGFVAAEIEVTVEEGESRSLSVTLDEEAAPGVSVIDHAFLIERFGGTDVDPLQFDETQDGFQAYLDAVGVTYFAAWEYVVPNNAAVAEQCGYTILLPERSWWRKAAALGLLADQLRALVNEPVTLRNWWRPPCYNEGVGGAAGGDHPDADALDLDFMSARSRADAQRYLCDEYWKKDLVGPEEIEPGSDLNPRLNMSVGLGGVTIHLGLLSRNGRRFWKYSSYTALSGSGDCW